MITDNEKKEGKNGNGSIVNILNLVGPKSGCRNSFRTVW